jgi:hypothetical protein
MKIRHLIVTAFLLGIAWACADLPHGVPDPHYGVDAWDERGFCKHELHGQIFSRTELLFGLNRPGHVVTEQEFQTFVDQHVTPSFPDGLTLLSGKGQFRSSSKQIEREDAKVLILLYPYTNNNNKAVEQIRKDYKDEFQQESVLRVDGQSCTSF